MSYFNILAEVSYEMSRPTIEDVAFEPENNNSFHGGEYWFSLDVLPSEFRSTYWEIVCDGNF